MNSKFSVKSGLSNNRRYAENAGYIMQSSGGGLIQNGSSCVIRFWIHPYLQEFFFSLCSPLIYGDDNPPFSLP